MTEIDKIVSFLSASVDKEKRIELDNQTLKGEQS
jgi:hypothetical protein